MAFWDDRPPLRGRPIRAETIRRMQEEVRRLSRVGTSLGPSGGITRSETRSGTTYRLHMPARIKARLTAAAPTAGSYYFQEVVGNVATAGAWVNGSTVGNSTNGIVAWEFNLVTGLTVGTSTGIVVDLWWVETASQWRFQGDLC